MEDPSFQQQIQQQVQQSMMTAQLQQQQVPAELPPDYSPGPYDICCGRGKRNWNHSGNKAFRELIQNRVDRYVEAPSKTAKTAVVVSIVDQIRHMGAHFLKQDKGGRWYDIGDQSAREKVGHSLRDQVSARQKNNKERAAADAAVSAAPAPILTGTAADLEQATSAAAMEFARKMTPVGGSLEHQSSTATVLHSNRGAAAPATATATSNLTAANLNQHQQYQQQLEQTHRPHQPPRNAGINNSWIHAATNAARRPSEVWSDFGGEEEQRRSTLDTTTVLENFGRRPSWLAMSFVDANNPASGGAAGGHTASLQQAAMQAAAQLQQEIQMEDESESAHIVIPNAAAPPAMAGPAAGGGIQGSVITSSLREAAMNAAKAIQHELGTAEEQQRQQQQQQLTSPPLPAPSAGGGIQESAITDSLREAAMKAAQALQNELGASAQAPGQPYHQQQPGNSVNTHPQASMMMPPPPPLQQQQEQPPQQQPLQQQPSPSDTLSGAVISINPQQMQQQQHPQPLWGSSPDQLAGAAAAGVASDEDDEERRASAISLMSVTDYPDDMSRVSFSNVFRSSMRKSSLSWASKEMQKIDWHQFCSSSHAGSDEEDEIGEFDALNGQRESSGINMMMMMNSNNPGLPQTEQQLAAKMEALVNQEAADAEMGDVDDL